MSHLNPPDRPDLQQKLQEILEDPDVRRLARRRAGHPDLAWDALQETFDAVAHVADPAAIKDLRAYFCRVLIRKIHRLSGQLGAALVDDFTRVADAHQERSVSTARAPRPFDEAVSLNLLAKGWFAYFAAQREELTASVPGRSGDHDRYRTEIVAVAERLLYAIVTANVSSADNDEGLRAAYPEWFIELGCPANTRHQRFSRARADVRTLLRKVVSRDDLRSLADVMAPGQLPDRCCYSFLVADEGDERLPSLGQVHIQASSDSSAEEHGTIGAARCRRRPCLPVSGRREGKRLGRCR